MHRAYFESRLFDESYWDRYFDLLAQSRFNSFVVIFGYENGGFMAPPYPYFFDVDSFPDVSLVGITVGQQRRNVLAFQRLIDAAHQRGIAVHAGIWDHIYRGGVQGGGIPGASKAPQEPATGLVWGVTADNLAAYNKAALGQFLDVFPEIDGIQFRMHGESGLRRDEMPRFWHEIFQLIQQQRPELRVDIRAKELPDSVIDDGLEQGIRIRVATKYWMEQMGMPFHPTHVNRPNQHDRRHGYADLLRYPQRYKVHWRLWNGGTTRVLLWGDPEYVRRFSQSARVYAGDSFEVNEPLATKMLARPHDEAPFALLNPPYRHDQWEFERYWHFYQVFGRLGYHRDTPAEIWEREFNRRFGSEAGPPVMQGLHLASQVLPRIVAASYRYRYFPTTRGWAEKQRMDDLPSFATAEGSDIEQFANFQKEADLILNGGTTAKRLPSETSRWFAHTSQAILQRVLEAERRMGPDRSPEFQSTVTDLKILAYLALYHSRRMPAAVSYNLFRQTQDLNALDDAMGGEQAAIKAWQELVQSAGDVYTRDLKMGIGHGGLAGHWKDELVSLQAGLLALEAKRDALPRTAREGQARIAHVPVRRALPAPDVTIRATLFSRGKPTEVHCLVNTTSGPQRRYAMTPKGNGRYAVKIPLTGDRQRLSYSLAAEDGDGRYAVFPPSETDRPIEIVVSHDRQPPSVDLDRVGSAQPRRAVRVTARVFDPSGVDCVRLRYRHLTQMEDYVTLEMALDEETGRYVAEIPAEFVIPQWNLMYFVEAIDGVGNGRMVPDLEKGMPYVIVPLNRE